MGILEQIKDKFASKIISFFQKNPRRYYLEVDPKDIVEFAKYLFFDLSLRFQIATGIDTEDCIEILYHFSCDKTGQIITLKIKIKDKQNPEVDSIGKFIKGAEWIEREIWELLGVNFKGHPNLEHLILAKDWPKGNYPLRQK